MTAPPKRGASKASTSTSWLSHKGVLAIAGPMIFSNITVPLLALVDTAVVGHLDHAYFLGGVAVGSTMTSFVFWFFGFLRMSTTGVTAQAFGTGIKEEQLGCLIQSLIMALLIGILIVLLHPVLMQTGFLFVDSSEEVEHYSQIYFEIRILSAPATLANFALIGWMLGMQHSRGPMWCLVLTNLINIGFDIVFVFGLNWHVEGVAIASVIADYCGFMIGAAFVWHVLQRQDIAINLGILRRLIRVLNFKSYLMLNRDMMLRTLLLQICFSFVTFYGASLGDHIVAANAVLLNLLLMISFGLDGIAYAAEAMVGRAYGEGSSTKVVRVFRFGVIWSVVFAVFYSSIFWIAGPSIVALLSDIPAVIETANGYLFWLILLPPLAMWCYLYDGVFIGLTRATDMRNSMLFSVAIGFFGCWWLARDWQNHALWFGLCGLMVVRGITLAGRFEWLRRRDRLVPCPQSPKETRPKDGLLSTDG
jgi:multidrug resistance protein, MATE family